MFQAESLAEVRSEVDELFRLHWEEIALNQDRIKLDPDFKVYEELARAGQFMFITCRVDGELVGYSAWIIRPHPHYKSTTFAYNDVIFLKKEHRRGRVGLELIKTSEYLMEVLGADKIQWHVKSSNDWGKILKRLGYVPEETVWGREL